MRSPRGRFAPSPTGDLHLGNASTALLAWLSIRSRRGSFVIRVEDLDRPRVRSGAVEGILEDLRWLGLDWDEGPDVSGPHAPYDQQSRIESYRAAIDRLRLDGRIYPCFCSRRDVAAAAAAPQEPGDEAVYPGTCRTIDPEEASRRVAAGAKPSWRYRVEPGEVPSFEDRVCGTWTPGRNSALGDFVVSRSDGVPAYQLAVVVDDDAMGINEVVRGEDLLVSTARQLLLYRALDRTPPVFGHVPLLLGPDGVRLSKRHHGTSIQELRARGATPERLVGVLAHLLGLRPTFSPVATTDLLDGFALTKVASRHGGIRVDVASWAI